jgi:hypothetical protein
LRLIDSTKLRKTMNFRKISTLGQVIALATVISVSSCKKDNNSTTNTDTSDAKAYGMTDSSTVADNVYSDVLVNAFIGEADNESVWSIKSSNHERVGTNSTSSTTANANFGCAVYSFDDSVPGEYPKVLTVDFGTGCTSLDGVARSGKIIYTFATGPLLSPGSAVSVQFVGYAVNGYGISGTYSIANNSSDQAGIVFATQVTNGIITYPNESTYHYSGSRTYTQTGGLSTPLDFTDDVYSFTGNSSFSSSDGTTLVCNVTTPLTWSFQCAHITAGILAFTYDENIKGTVDFGDGTCDDSALLKIGSYTKTITLK